MQESNSDPTPPPSQDLDGEAALALAIDRLVDEAGHGDAESVERCLLSTLVELDLTTAAGIWRRAANGSEWVPVRSYGGATPPPPTGFTSPTCHAFDLSEGASVVVLRAPFRPTESWDELEETIDVLVSLTATLAAACPRGPRNAASPLPQRRRDTGS